MKIIIIIALLLLGSTAVVFATPNPVNMVYVEVNTNNITNVACYLRKDNGQPFFNIVSVFAANIHGDDPNAPQIYFNQKVDQLLNHSDAIQQLHAKGIKVLITLLGDRQNAGWSCMTDPAAAATFANNIAAMLNKYQADGVDIDDEYSLCTFNPTSITMIAQALKTNPAFKGKLLTMALYGDEADFETAYNGHKLAEYLDYGWEMDYGNSSFDGRLAPYLQNGMTKNNLTIGASTLVNYPSAADVVEYLQSNHYSNSMIYNITAASDSEGYAEQFTTADGVPVTVPLGCLQ